MFSFVYTNEHYSTVGFWNRKCALISLRPVLNRVSPQKMGVAGFTFAAISPTPSLHLARFGASSLLKPTFQISSSTRLFHVFFGRPRFLRYSENVYTLTRKWLSEESPILHTWMDIEMDIYNMEKITASVTTNWNSFWQIGGNNTKKKESRFKTLPHWLS